MTIGDTIVAGNAANTSPDLSGTIDQDQGYNLIGDGDGASGFTAAGDQVGTAASPIDPLLAPLGDYGGPTQTMALLPGSPAIDKGDNTLVPIDPSTGLPVTTDQRGFTRVVNGTVDIGAFEDQVVVTTPANAQAPPRRASPPSTSARLPIPPSIPATPPSSSTSATARPR